MHNHARSSDAPVTGAGVVEKPSRQLPPGRPMVEDVQTLSLVLARKVALACFPSQVGNVTIYDVPRGWVTAVLRDDPDIVTAESTFDVNDFFNRADIETILIPSGSPVSRAALERMCAFCGLRKKIFIEVVDE